MNDLVRYKLRELMIKYGRSLCNDPRRCEALLKDHCGKYKREIYVLISALKNRVVEDLLKAPTGIPQSIINGRLCRRLEDELAMTTEAAYWAVESWVMVLKTGGEDIEAVEILRKSGIDFTLDVFLEKICKGDHEAVRLLIAAGIDVNAKAGYTGATALIQASVIGQTEIVKLLLVHGAYIDATYERRRTALMEVADNLSIEEEFYGFDSARETVKVLLTNGADPNIKDQDGSTALMLASGMDFVEIVRILMCYKADPNIKDKHGSTALIEAAQCGYTEIIQVILGHGAYIDPENSDAALMWAVQENHKEIAQILLEYSAKNSSGLLANRYCDHGDGTVTDVWTGLQWMQEKLWNHQYSWQDAMDAAESLNDQGGYAGYCDWRVPTCEELKTLIYCASGQPETWPESCGPCQGDYGCPTIYQPAFPNTPDGWFWSSSDYLEDDEFNYCAEGVDFSDGSVDFVYKETLACKIYGYVRLVRSKPPATDWRN